ncbi:MAG: type I 3-dehydroquinate dehydratase [Methanomicrobiales archaeon]|nr:type I 3-dehydroquinate dehydratase [Methanomicrobiales archaeon]NYT20757.1 type I 3-dehydroquinate dehydratase [Methanomicrobiales archaeon]
MQLVASVADPMDIPGAETEGADAIELRLDLFPATLPESSCRAVRECRLPIILTVRSRDEGGAFSGGIKEWEVLMEPWLSLAAMVDIEQRFSAAAPGYRELGKEIIASFHTAAMPSGEELREIESRLRRYGIPKIVVGPRSLDDVLSFCSFTLHSEHPVITSIMGSRFRFARLILPLFGSSFLFCAAGRPTAEGQFPVREARALMDALAR